MKNSERKAQAKLAKSPPVARNPMVSPYKNRDSWFSNSIVLYWLLGLCKIADDCNFQSSKTIENYKIIKVLLRIFKFNDRIFTKENKIKLSEDYKNKLLKTDKDLYQGFKMYQSNYKNNNECINLASIEDLQSNGFMLTALKEANQAPDVPIRQCILLLNKIYNTILAIVKPRKIKNLIIKKALKKNINENQINLENSGLLSNTNNLESTEDRSQNNQTF